MDDHCFLILSKKKKDPRNELMEASGLKTQNYKNARDNNKNVYNTDLTHTHKNMSRSQGDDFGTESPAHSIIVFNTQSINQDNLRNQLSIDTAKN